jgi:hypothetical protein
MLAVLAIALVMLGAYVVGYFWLGDKLIGGANTVRYFGYRWQSTIFQPAARVEAYLTRVRTTVVSQDAIDEALYR